MDDRPCPKGQHSGLPVMERGFCDIGSLLLWMILVLDGVRIDSTLDRFGGRFLMRSRAILLIVAGGLMVASCGGGESDSNSQPELPPTAGSAQTAPKAVSAGSGCGAVHVPGEYEEAGMFGDIEQPYWMVVPDVYDESVPAPLYLNLPSGGGSHHVGMDGWRPYLDDLNGLMVIISTENPEAASPDALVSLIDQISSDYCVNPKQVHVMGTAWTGPIAENLACSASERIASFVSAPNIANGPDCTPSRPVPPLLTLTGDADRSMTTDLVARWTDINDCNPEPVVEDLGSGVFQKAFQNCKADILFYDIQGMDHCFVFHEAKGPAAVFVCEYEEFDYLQGALKFFAEHPLP